MEVPRAFANYFLLNEIGKNTFRTVGPIMAFRGIAYGGHLLSAAVKAAMLTLPSTPHSNSMTVSNVQSSYLRPARPDIVTYEVTQTKDGQVFSQRDVVCKQDDKLIFKCSVSFHSPDPQGAHLPYNKDTKPSIPSSTDTNYTCPTSWHYIYKFYSKLVEPFPLKFRFLPPSLPPSSLSADQSNDTKLSVRPIEPRFRFWSKSKESINTWSHNEHHLGIIFGSDVIMPGAVLGLYPLYKFDLVATLNHTIWFENNNKSIDINQWTLFDVECMSSCNGTTLNISRIFQEDGTLIATTVQQGYIKKAKL